MIDKDWVHLMVAAQSGDKAVYQRLLAHLGIWLRSYYARRLPSSMTDDAMQETLIAIDQKLHSYDSRRPFGPWLAAIARHKWIDRLRAIKATPIIDLLDDVHVSGHAEATCSAFDLDRLLTSLKPAQSSVIRLVKLEGFSIEETSVRTGQSMALVKVNIHRGLARLAALARHPADDPSKRHPTVLASKAMID